MAGKKLSANMLFSVWCFCTVVAGLEREMTVNVEAGHRRRVGAAVGAGHQLPADQPPRPPHIRRVQEA